MLTYLTASARRALLIAGLIACLGVESLAQAPIILVRHAERADAGAGAPAMGADPSLSAAGHARAAALAEVLKDLGVTNIFVTEYKRTQETAGPLAKALNLSPTIVAAKDTERLVEHVRQSTGAVLVVGHSNTVPDIIEALGVTAPVVIGDDDYDNLFIVVPGQEPRLLRLQFR